MSPEHFVYWLTGFLTAQPSGLSGEEVGKLRMILAEVDLGGSK